MLSAIHITSAHQQVDGHRLVSHKLPRTTGHGRADWFLDCLLILCLTLTTFPSDVPSFSVEDKNFTKHYNRWTHEVYKRTKNVFTNYSNVELSFVFTLV
jgi:hypothetical protein